MSTDPTYHARGDAVFCRPVTTVGPDGRTRTTFGFAVCTVDEYVSGEDGRSGAEEVALQLNKGELAQEMMTALRRARFVLESPVIAHLVNGAGTLDLVRATIAKAEKLMLLSDGESDGH